MTRMIPQTVLFLSASALMSCAPVRNAGQDDATTEKADSSLRARLAAIPRPKMPDFSLADLMPGPKIKVVEVREKDLKEMPTGTELAKAHRGQGIPGGQGIAGFWPFSGKLYFEEPDFPEPGADMDGSLLPPKMP